MKDCDIPIVALYEAGLRDVVRVSGKEEDSNESVTLGDSDSVLSVDIENGVCE